MASQAAYGAAATLAADLAGDSRWPPARRRPSARSRAAARYSRPGGQPRSQAAAALPAATSETGAAATISAAAAASPTPERARGRAPGRAQAGVSADHRLTWRCRVRPGRTPGQRRARRQRPDLDPAASAAERLPGPGHGRPGGGRAQVDDARVPGRPARHPDVGGRAAVVAGPASSSRMMAVVRLHGLRGQLGLDRPALAGPGERRARPASAPRRRAGARAARRGRPAGPAAAARCASTPAAAA